MGKGLSISFSSSFSLGNVATNHINYQTNSKNNHSSNNTDDQSTPQPHQYSRQQGSSPDIEANGNKCKKTNNSSRRALAPLILPSDCALPFLFFLSRKLIRKRSQPTLFLALFIVGALAWTLTSGAITLDSFNDTIRYLPGYHVFANNLLYLVMFLLFLSFTILATLPFLPILILGLPFHLLIFSIFNRLMDEWLVWCTSCYTILFLAPFGSMIMTWIKAIVIQQQLQSESCREPFIHQKSPSELSSSLHLMPSPPSSFPLPAARLKYSPFNDENSKSDIAANKRESRSVMDHLLDDFKIALIAVTTNVECLIHLVSLSNHKSTRWRLLLALAFWLSYVIPVTVKNEPRTFDPTRSAPSFGIQHPGLLCSATEMEGSQPLYDSFEGYWQDYLQLHRSMVLPETEGGIPESQKRFLVFQPSDDGLGNRLQALMSSVVMGMITRRAVILDWVATPQCNANFTDLFEPPEGLQWDLNSVIPNHKDLDSYKAKPVIWYPYCRNCALRSPITPNSPWSPLLCDADLGIDPTWPVVQILSTQWFLPVLQHNPHHRQQLCHMFPHQGLHGDNNAFELLAKRLLKPSKPVQTKIDSVMDRIPQGVKLIGLQVRRTENNAVGRGIEDSFLSCAAEVIEEEEVHSDDGQPSMVQRGHSFGPRTLVDEFGSKSKSTKTQKYAYYLATDYRPTRAYFQKLLGDQLYVLENTFHSYNGSASPSSISITTENDAPNGDKESSPDKHCNNDDRSIPSLALPPSVQVSGSGTGSRSSSTIQQTKAVVRNSVQGVQNAVAEMYLLAQADRIISSPYSTFGYFAHAYSNIRPNIVKRDGTCIKRRSTQPCFQYWFGFANGGAHCNIKATIEMSEDYDCWL
ncbi:hypothetical protein BX616_000383 [Lobosporangium transversale]|uniref:Uncharacterized protein n=1 Tax=Lobosporangium transversale TaxID=64571 RepID=A0A1Y2GGK1_9FUNG|nr:hypothetical protein BCR41DRAFT_388051 [Lobosporangium transversale]KAF9907603.1 hypothetical protein BX616_000383 [Lobosporangium transversale]ORZ10311.1 hypothetical protein BCR41DRAFT_388051 [Lobosporangium transversale]|eukprot:XP_021879218.1 hypothetical protein BCR41DRAFT_388051 [Lobosporangium transversale]